MSSQSSHHTAAAPTGAHPVYRHRPRMEDLLRDAALQRELRAVAGRVQGLLAGRVVVEPVCGDGWWTAHLAQAAQSVTALEADPDSLRRAAARRLPPGRVRLMEAAPEAVERLPGAFDAAFTVFLCDGPGDPWRMDILALLHARLGPGGTMVVVGVRASDPASAAISEATLRARVRETAPDARAVRLDVGERLWCLSYTL